MANWNELDVAVLAGKGALLSHPTTEHSVGARPGLTTRLGSSFLSTAALESIRTVRVVSCVACSLFDQGK